MLQVRFATDVPDTKQAHWHAAQQDAAQQHPEHPPFKRRYVARVSLALDFGPAEGQPENRQMLFQILGTMPSESRLRSVKELELCAKAKLEELARAQPGTTKNNHTRHRRCGAKFRETLDKAAPVTSEPGENKSTAWLCSPGASSTLRTRLLPKTCVRLARHRALGPQRPTVALRN